MLPKLLAKRQLVNIAAAVAGDGGGGIEQKYFPSIFAYRSGDICSGRWQAANLCAMPVGINKAMLRLLTCKGSACGMGGGDSEV